MKLSYNKVFDRYTMSFSDKLAESSYSLYRTLRLQLAKIFPLSEHEKYRFDDDLFSKEEAADMPQGFDYISRLIELPTMHQRITPAYAGIISMEKMRGYVYLLSAAEITPETIICRR